MWSLMGISPTLKVIHELLPCSKCCKLEKKEKISLIYLLWRAFISDVLSVICTALHIKMCKLLYEVRNLAQETDAFAYQLEYLWTLVIPENAGWFELIIFLLVHIWRVHTWQGNLSHADGDYCGMQGWSRHSGTHSSRYTQVWDCKSRQDIQK